MKPDNAKYHVISPSGIPLTPEPFASKRAAEEFSREWIKGLREQGYFPAVGRKIPVGELADHLVIVPESEAHDVMIKMWDEQKNRGRKALDELMLHADNYVNDTMRQCGELAATVFMIGPDGITGFSRADVADDGKKRDFIYTTRMMCIAHDATAAVLCSEAWMRSNKAGERRDQSLSPAESPDRQEVVILMGESRENTIQKVLPLERSEEGEFMSLGQGPEIYDAKITGQFASFLPEESPDEVSKQMAKQYLASHGMRLGKKNRMERGFGW